ncbi:MAG: MarR family transcriptional regulator [Methanospirillum sp.]|nr:MarR family transcriptional regulator [Methanospirillum sp.]
MNQESLSQKINVDKATVTRAIQRLIDEGYVARERDEDDKRAYRVFLTKNGKGIKPDIIAIARRWDEILLSNLDSDQRNIMAGALDTMIENVSEHMKR